MELVKNIFFNTDKLVENTKIKISYTGILFEENSSDVYLHYGYGLQWDNVSEIKMEKTELGYQAEIELKSSDSLNLCFRNSEDVWDNNNYQNYSQESLNRNLPIFASYEPGSTFKIITTSAAVEEKVVDLEKDHFHDSGSVNVDGSVLKCWKAGGHGDQTFLQVLQNSCNLGVNTGTYLNLKKNLQII